MTADHEPEGVGCSCGWEPQLGESIRRAFDRHLLEVLDADR